MGEEARLAAEMPAQEPMRPSAGGVAVLAALALSACAAPTAQNRDYAWENSVLNLMDQPEDRQFAGAQDGERPERVSQRERQLPLRMRPARVVPMVEPSRIAAEEQTPPAQSPQARQEPQSPPKADQGPDGGENREPPQSMPAQMPAAPSTAPAPQGDQSLRAVQRVEAAQTLLGTPGLQERAFVAHVLRAAGQDIAVDAKQPYAASLWRKLEVAGAKVAIADAKPGDLIFFRDTADLNGNGRPDDGVTLVGVVERVRGNHAVFIAQRAGKVRRMAVDGTRPLVIRDGAGEVINTRLVRWPGSDTPWTTGQCLYGFGRPQ